MHLQRFFEGIVELPTFLTEPQHQPKCPTLSYPEMKVVYLLSSSLSLTVVECENDFFRRKISSATEKWWMPPGRAKREPYLKWVWWFALSMLSSSTLLWKRYLKKAGKKAMTWPERKKPPDCWFWGPKLEDQKMVWKLVKAVVVMMWASGDWWKDMTSSE